MSKRAPELSWEDKAILVVIPVVVLIIFVVANYITGDLTVKDAFDQKLPKVEVRDGGIIHQVLPPEKSASGTALLCRIKTRDGAHEFTFKYNVQASETMNLQPGRAIQFTGEYQYNDKGGVIEVPFKGKSGRWSGWAVYENHRYYSITEDKENSGL
ncbi:MAG: DUF3465 domain-containing protein [Candidatus Riflebacteria bacterium]|nr:DUF3465 domain-containing protein [Candidatus Riflebacteria bacterium]